MRRVNSFILSTVSIAALAATPAFAQAGQTASDQASPQAVESGQPTPTCDVPPGTPLPQGCAAAAQPGEVITVTVVWAMTVLSETRYAAFPRIKSGVSPLLRMSE